MINMRMLFNMMMITMLFIWIITRRLRNMAYRFA